MIGLLVVSLASAGCKGIVLDPLESGPAGEGTGGAGGSPTADVPSAIAMRFSVWPQAAFNPGSPFSLSFTNGTPDPNALVLVFASRAPSCAAPHIDFEPSEDPAACPQQAFWQVILVIPPDRQQLGVLDLDDPTIFAYRAVWDASCGGGSGSTPGITGTLTITSLGATAVEAKLDLAPSTGWVWQNGDYTAPYCP
jgi:hypothetical protein